MDCPVPFPMMPSLEEAQPHTHVEEGLDISSTPQPQHILTPSTAMVTSSTQVSGRVGVAGLPDNNAPDQDSESWFCNVVNERLNIPTGYLSVAVLMLRWHEDIDSFGDGHSDEIKELKHVFQSQFNYKCSEVHLDTTRKPQHALNFAIMQHVMDNDGPNNLLIVYYTGHGRLHAEGKLSRLELSATRTLKSRARIRYSATAFWDEAERPLVSSAESDVLTILDCCFASNAQKDGKEQGRAYELIAASPRDEPTRGPGRHSFTTALIKSLRELLNENKHRNFDTFKLVQRINKDRSPPAMLWNRLEEYEPLHGSHVQLAPVDHRSSVQSKGRFKPVEPEEAWLKLRFSLGENRLSQGQIEELARRLPDAFDIAKVKLRRIDWLKMESVITTSATKTLAGLATAVWIGQKLMRRSKDVIKRRDGTNALATGERLLSDHFTPTDIDRSDVVMLKKREGDGNIVSTMTNPNGKTQRQFPKLPPISTKIPRAGQVPVEVIGPAPTELLDNQPLCQPKDEETEREVQREAQRQAWFQNKANDLLDIPNGYDKVAVLIVRWHESIDEFQAYTGEIQRLEALFKGRFNFVCETVKLENNRKPQKTLNHAISRHVFEHDGPNNLVIVYYTGHGSIIENETGRCLELSATEKRVERRNAYSPVAFWDEAELPLCQSAEGDVLSILDCCFASSAALRSRSEESRNYHLLAASAADRPMDWPGAKSFTTALIDSLGELLDESTGGSFPVTKLWERINMKRESHPSLLWDRLNNYKRSLQLAPLDPNRHQQRKDFLASEGDQERASLLLRFSLKENDLVKQQIEAFAYHLTEACLESRIDIGRIDWIKMAPSPRQQMSFSTAVRVLSAVQSFKSKYHARKQNVGQPSNSPGRAKRRFIGDSPSNTKRRTSERLRSNTPMPISPKSLTSSAGDPISLSE